MGYSYFSAFWSLALEFGSAFLVFGVVNLVVFVEVVETGNFVNHGLGIGSFRLAAEAVEEDDDQGGGDEGGDADDEEVVVFDGGGSPLPEGGLGKAGEFDFESSALGEIGDAPDAVGGFADGCLWGFRHA